MINIREYSLKGVFNIKLLLLLFFSIIGLATSFAQTDLVRWNDTNYTPTIVASNITASNITNAGGVNIAHQDWGATANFFETGSGGSWAAEGINTSRYIEFTISANTGYKVEADLFNFYYRAGWTPLTFEVRYSKDNFATYFTAVGSTSTSNSWTSASANITSANPILPGETLRVRIYAYNTGATFHIKRLFNTGSPTNYSETPTITGTVSLAVPTAEDDNAVTAENVAVDIDILDNDTYSTLSAITITQQPSNGQNITINGLTDVTYTPNTGYLGADSFKYTITDENGTSDEATVNITVSLPTPPTAVADTASVPADQTTNINVLANDTPGSGAFDYVTIISNPANGTAIVNPNNTIAYTPGTSYTGADSFQYNVTNIHTLTSNTVTVTIDVTCNCTHTVSGSSITVNSGEVYCLASGSWSGGVVMNGGTVCIAAGATFNASYTPPGLHSGTIINRGTVTAYPLSTGNNHTVHIENFGTFTSAYLHDFAGSIRNNGTFQVNGGLETLNGCDIKNYGEMTSQAISFYGTTVTNYNGAEFTTTNSVNVYSGYWDNRLGGEIYFNGGNVNFTGDLDNSGYWEFERLSSLSSLLNNYGQMKVYNQASNISSTTYLTNDDLLEFIDVPEIQYNGPMLTNNGTITVTHSTTGNFKMNQAINQVFNNGLIVTSGQFEQNAAGSLLVNNCTIECERYFVGNGKTVNSGLIWALGNVDIQGTASIVENAATGHIRGTNFTNSGEITGYGGFYFTGNTNMNTGGSFIGDEPNSILFFDASQTGTNIFDTPGGTVINVIRPDTMTPYDTDTYECTAPPSVAGYPPTTNPVDLIFCEPQTVVFSIDDYAEPHEPVDNPFSLLYNTIKLFEYDNESNPTNNSTELVISGKGTLTANTSTGAITFTPLVSFTSGIVEAEYRISNERTGDPIIYPSPKTKITIIFILIDLPPIAIELGTNPVCVSQTVTLSNTVPDGVWESSNETVATVDENGVVTGAALGTAIISYTVTEETCEETVEQEISVEICGGSLLITNPMIHSRMKSN